jgi:hypothetical protein
VRPVLERRGQVVLCDEAAVQRRIGGDERGLERELPREIGQRARDGGDEQPVDEHHLVGFQGGGVQVQDPAAPRARRAVAGGVHAVEADGPEGKPVHHRGRGVAHDGVSRQPGQRGLHRLQVPGRGVVGRCSAEVDPRPERGEIAAATKAAQLRVRDAVGEQVRAQVEPGAERVHAPDGGL